MNQETRVEEEAVPSLQTPQVEHKATPAAEGEQVLTRLQRSLTGGLFMHKDKQIFVTFSDGVTGYRMAERIEDSLERADQALYEAKRTGKNRTCIG